MTRPTWLLVSAVAAAVPLGTLAVDLGSLGPDAAAQTTPTTSPKVDLPTSTVAADVVDAVEAFLATLSEPQRAIAQIELKPELAGRWSNLPVGAVARNGVFFRDLTTEQVEAALKVARLALSQEGFARFQEIRASDDVFARGRGGPGGGGPGGPPQKKAGGVAKKKGGGPGGAGPSFGSAHYMIAFLGKPSKTTPWLLQLGGHHLAFNIAYKGTGGAPTPYFLGAQPTTWKDDDGKTHAPLAPMRDAMHSLVTSLTPDQQQRAHLDKRFNDVYVGPGRDGKFPAHEGLPVAELAEPSKDLVKQVIAAWTGDNAQAAEFRKIYDAELDQIKVSYSGSTNVSSRGDYVRIDGPRVWIEFCSQGDDHYHTIWRDRLTDYGAEFSF